MLKSASSSSANHVPLPPPTQFANNAAIKVPVLPALNAPVSLGQHPKPQQPAKHHDTVDADLLIEELMKEAETDPKLREMSGLNKPPQVPMVNEKYTMVKRPYRTQQDIIIRDEKVQQTSSEGSRSSRPLEKYKMVERPYRTNEDIRISAIDSRSKSADGRLHNMQRKDPKLSNFMRQRTTSTENFTEEIMNEVVTDQDHHSVKDLVAMIEKNTKSESANAYVRKWGCDLISPEPHTRNVTYRRERKEFEESQRNNRKSAYNWTKDDEFQRRNKVDFNDNASTMGHNQFEIDNDFQMGAHVAELDDLIGRPPQSLRTDAEPSYAYQEPQSQQSDYADYQPQQESDYYQHNGYSHPQDRQAYSGQYQASHGHHQQKQQQQHQRQQNGLHEADIDRQISHIQDEFETELDSLIDTYREIKGSTKKTNYSAPSSSAKTSKGSICFLLVNLN